MRAVAQGFSSDCTKNPAFSSVQAKLFLCTMTKADSDKVRVRFAAASRAPHKQRKAPHCRIESRTRSFFSCLFCCGYALDVPQHPNAAQPLPSARTSRPQCAARVPSCPNIARQTPRNAGAKSTPEIRIAIIISSSVLFTSLL